MKRWMLGNVCHSWLSSHFERSLQWKLVTDLQSRQLPFFIVIPPQYTRNRKPTSLMNLLVFTIISPVNFFNDVARRLTDFRDWAYMHRWMSPIKHICFYYIINGFNERYIFSLNIGVFFFIVTDDYENKK